jgi:sec-independent protein translocase protein TatA
MGGISIWQLLIILVIVLLLFGTKRLKNLGADLGGAIKGFRSAMSDPERQDDGDAQSTGQLGVQNAQSETSANPARDKAQATSTKSADSADS